MKKIATLLFLLLAITVSIDTMGSDTLYFRFSNVYIKDASPNDTLIMDIMIKSSTSGTYLTGSQIDLELNTAVFGNNPQPVSITHLEMVGSAMVLALGSNPSSNRYRYAVSQMFPPFDPTSLSLVPSVSWGGLFRLKFLIINNSQNLGIQFLTTPMTGQQKFVTVYTPTGLPSVYTPILAFNNLLNVPSTPTSLNLMISELGDPSNSNADFVEIYNPGSTSADFGINSWYLTVYNGTTYQSVQLTGTSNATDAYVVGGSAYAAAYPGKSPDQVSGIIPQNGTVTWYLTFYGPYPSGILVDKYDGSSMPFTGKHAVRKYPVTAPNTTFTSTEWSVTTAVNMDMTPGSHRTTLSWDGSTDIDWFDTANWTPSYVPDAGHNAQVPVFIVPPPTVTTGSNANVHNVDNGSSGSK